MRINCAGESGIVYRILIVDDEKVERTGLRLLLGKMDQKFEITEAVNGKEALEWLSCNRAVLLCTLGVACFIAADVGIGFVSVL